MMRIAFEPHGYNTKYLLTHPWELVIYYGRELKYFIQRGLYGYADNDWWSIDYYLSQWMPSAVRKVGAGHGYPGRGEANTPQKWKAICEKIAKGFEASYKISEYDYKGSMEMQKLQKQQQEGLKLFVRWFDSLWD